MAEDDTKQINGLGRRVNSQEVTIGKLEVRVERTEEDIRTVWSSIASINCDTAEIKRSIGKVVTENAKIQGVMSILTLILVYVITHIVK